MSEVYGQGLHRVSSSMIFNFTQKLKRRDHIHVYIELRVLTRDEMVGMITE